MSNKQVNAKLYCFTQIHNFYVVTFILGDTIFILLHECIASRSAETLRPRATDLATVFSTL